MTMTLTPTPYWRGIVDRTLQDHGDTLQEHEKKIDVLERFMWKLLGAALFGSVLGGVLTTVVAYAVINALHLHR